MDSSSPSDRRPVPSFESLIKHPWSQIVRGDAESSPKKPSSSAIGPQGAKKPISSIAPGLVEPDRSQARVSIQTSAEPGASNLDPPSEDGAEGRVFDEASPNGDEAAELLKIAANAVVRNAVTSDGSEASQNKLPKGSHGDSAEPGVSRPIWKKPCVNLDGESTYQPVMGADSWPALAEARNIKISETQKSKASGITTPPSTAAMSSSSIQGPMAKGSIPPGNPQSGFKTKPYFNGGGTGRGRTAFQPIENGPSTFEHPGSVQSIKSNMHIRAKGNIPAHPPVDPERASHHSPFPNNMRKWRNNNRDPGRGNYGWNHHGRAYENAGDMVTLLHEQRIGPRNMPRPHPMMNANPSHYPGPNFQNGGMYYMPSGAPEYGSPFFPPIPQVGGMMHGPDPLTLRSMLLKQIDYYFSIENLCRDVFLRTHMDEQGFVPVSVIARFNRIRTLSPNPMVILEALQQSDVVEVQHDRIRRRNDGGKWKLVPDQVFNGSPARKSMAPVMSVEGENRKPEPVRAPYSQAASVGVSAVSDMASTDSESLRLGHDRVYGGSGSTGPAERGAQCSPDYSNPHKDQFDSVASELMVGLSDITIGGTHGNDTTNSTDLDSTGLLRARLRPIQAGNDVMRRDSVSHNKESYLGDARILESSCIAPEPSIASGSGSWKNSDDFWIENKTYFTHGDFGQDASLPLNSESMLKGNHGKDEDRAKVNDRDVQRLIGATHGPFGSFIAVP